MNITDPDGTAFRIDRADGRGLITSNVLDRGAYISERDHELWSVEAIGDFAAADTWLFVANESTTLKLYVDRIMGYCDLAGLFQVHLPDYPAIAGNALVPVRLHNPTLAGAPEVDAESDETGNAQARVFYERYLAANEYWEVELRGRVILGYHECIAVDYAANGGATTFASCHFWME